MGERALREFLSDIKCYDLVPISSKVLACDVDISLRLAFYAFVEHGMSKRERNASLRCSLISPCTQACSLPYCGIAEKVHLVEC